ncbi:MAG TPA: hypothetical protein VFC78_07445 [Tepidisphaeraceae bacterium]|nr:hypothetical protein [Tepidisphaeraceae bacterium]
MPAAMPPSTVLSDVYSEIGVPADRLPYSEAIERLTAEYSRRVGLPSSPAACWREILRLRKDGKLPRLGRG